MIRTPLAIPETIFNREEFSQALSGGKSLPSIFKKSIAKTTEFFHQQFKQDVNIRSLIWARSDFIDQLIICAWNLYSWSDNISLCAVGGYGRGELHPHSDIDILILLGDESPDTIEQHKDNISQFVTLLWDMNLNIGHSVRTIDECFSEAKKDISITTNLMESRTLVGPENILREALELCDNTIWPSRDFFRAKWDEQIARHDKHGRSEYNLEPNVKNSPGGLRDIQMIAWIAKRHFDISDMNDLVEKGFLLEGELSVLNQGMDFLWKVRYALHMISNRAEDRLLFDHQRTLAKMFGFEDDDARLAVERFMQQYYRWASALGQLNDLLIQHFDETILRACEAETVYDINPRFRVRNGHIEAANDKVFERTPSALLEVFLLSAEAPNIDGVRASTIRLIRQNRHLINDEFRNDPNNARFFMDILRCKEKVALQLRRMLRFGILGVYLPEFKAITGQMQHDLFHIYSVDAHTMEVVKNLRRFHYPKFQKKFPVATRIVRRMEKVELLYIAGLYHDIAKGRGGDHSELGVEDVVNFGIRHHLDKEDIALTAWLVRHHLLMSSVAQRKDISNPEVIRDFAEIVRTQEQLDYLFALTVADINATNPTLWNSWRASLLRQLYNETKRALRRGFNTPIDKQDWIDEAQDHAIEQLEDLGFTESEIRNIWAFTNDDYFLREKVDDIVWHTESIAQHQNTDQPLILTKETGELDNEGATQIFIHTQERPALFALIASALEQLDLNIVDARIYSTHNQFSIHTFYVLDANNEPFDNASHRITAIIDALQEQLQSSDDYVEIFSKRLPRKMRLFSTPTSTEFSQDEHLGLSVLEIMTPDRPGLLARIGKIFLDYNVLIQNVKITTLGERVEDVFFITNDQGLPITDSILANNIQSAICTELDEQAAIQS